MLKSTLTTIQARLPGSSFKQQCYKRGKVAAPQRTQSLGKKKKSSPFFVVQRPLAEAFGASAYKNASSA
jgi:hypothetical protein